MKERQLFIGDVHGCYRELELLLRKAGYSPLDTQLYFVGDLVHKGADSVRVYQRSKELGAICVAGNHEYIHLIDSDPDRFGIPEKGGIIRRFSSPEIRRLEEDFGARGYEEFLADIAEWPTLIQKEGFILVHAGLTPHKSPQDSLLNDRLYLRKWSDPSRPHKPARPWFDYYQGSRPVIFGHWGRLGGIARDNLFGLDGGCVYGGSLSALSLPDGALFHQQKL